MTTWNRNEPTSAARTAVLVISSLTDGSFAPAATDFSSAIKIRLGGTSWTAAGGTLTNTGYDGHWVYVALQSETNLTANEVELRIDDPTYYAQTLIQLSDFTTTRAGYLDNLSAGAVATASALAAVQSDTDDIQTRLPAALVSGRMDSSVGAYQSGQAPLQPTVAGRTLDVSATGEAGLDWANIGSPTTTVNLSGTTIKTATDVATLDTAIKAKTDHLPSVDAGAVNGLPIITAIGQGPGGQLKPNSFIDNYIYDVNKNPTSWRVRIFATKTACDAAVAGHADNADNEVERYNFTATYNPVDRTLTTYKIDKSL